MNEHTILLIREKLKTIEMLENMMKTASIEDRLWCYEPKIEQLKAEIRVLSK